MFSFVIFNSALSLQYSLFYEGDFFDNGPVRVSFLATATVELMSKSAILVKRECNEPTHALN